MEGNIVHLLLMSIVNVFIIYKKSRDKNDCHLADFTTHFAKHLLNKEEWSSYTQNRVVPYAVFQFAISKKTFLQQKKISNPQRKSKVCAKTKLMRRRLEKKQDATVHHVFTIQHSLWSHSASQHFIQNVIYCK